MNAVHVLTVTDLLTQRPQQQRAAELLDRLVAAAEELFGSRAYHEIRVADIARAAEVSVGIVYTRFATKEHLLLHCAERLVESLDQGVVDRLAALSDNASVEAVARRYFTFAAESFVTHRAILRPVSLLVRSPEHPALRPMVAHFNRRAHGALHDALRTAFERVTGAQRAARRAEAVPNTAAIHLAIETASALLRERVLYRDECHLESARREGRRAAGVCVAVLRGGVA